MALDQKVFIRSNHYPKSDPLIFGKSDDPNYDPIFLRLFDQSEILSYTKICQLIVKIGKFQIRLDRIGS